MCVYIYAVEVVFSLLLCALRVLCICGCISNRKFTRRGGTNDGFSKGHTLTAFYVRKAPSGREKLNLTRFTIWVFVRLWVFFSVWLVFWRGCSLSERYLSNAYSYLHIWLAHETRAYTVFCFDAPIPLGSIRKRWFSHYCPNRSSLWFRVRLSGGVTPI